MEKTITRSRLSETEIEKLAHYIHKKAVREKKDTAYASAKQVLTYFGMGLTIASAFLAPRATAALAQTFFAEERKYDPSAWKRFNTAYLKQTLKRLEKQKLIKRTVRGGKEVLGISQKGKEKVLTLSLKELFIKEPESWDSKWRVVIYDIPTRQHRLAKLIRETFKSLGFYPLQESVYIIPYPCYEEVEFLRSHYGLDSQIKYLLVSNIEDDQVYRDYFGI